MRERTRTQPVIEVDGRASIVSEMPLRPSVTGSIAESYDDTSPRALTTPEREHIFADLQTHSNILGEYEQRLDALEQTVQELKNNKSIPVTVNGPKGISVVGSWKIVAFLAILTAFVATTYIALPYFKPVQTQERTTK